jgi:UDP-N-acetylmuramate dehydrogenase
VEKKVSLKKYTTLGIGGKADFFASFQNEKELIDLIAEAQRLKLCFFVIGGGSNVLIPDSGYRGLVLKNEMKKIKEKKEKNILVESGASLAKTVSFCLAHGLTGLEWTAGIPGTIGGAIKGNAGAFGSSMKDSIVSVKVYDTEKRKTKTLKNKDCFFQYRESFFKKKKNLIILSAEIKLEKEKASLINEKIKFFLNQRKEKQPHGFSAGSVFKNYEIKNEKEKKQLLEKSPELKTKIKGNMVPVAFLIEKCGLKGEIVGQAMVSRVHANFIINLGQAKQSDVSKLISRIEKKVQEKFKVSLEKEIIFVE